MELLERARPLADLDDLLTATAGGGRVAVVAGEAGAGKSSLVTAFAEACGVRARVVWGGCDPLLTPRALGPLHDIARQIGGALAEATAAGQRAEAFEALLAALDGPRQRVRPVVVIEDLHWADEATLDMVAFLGRRLSRLRVLLVLTFRDDEIGPEHHLRTVLAGLPSDLVRRFTLEPLSRSAVADLARLSGRSHARVHELTGGNPLLVTELIATAPDVPPTVRDLMLSRINARSAAARAVAGLVSVVPSQAEAALLRDHAEAVDECLAAGVLTTSGDGVKFRHELLRRAVEESLSPVRRAALHAEVLAQLATRPGVDPARLVHHAHHAGDDAALLRWAPVAAENAAELGAYRQAAAHYAQALPLTAGWAAAERAEMLEAYATVAYHGGLIPEALTAMRQALPLREATGNAERVGDDLRVISRLTWWNGSLEEAVTAADRAIEVLSTLPPGSTLAAALSHRAGLHNLAEEPEETILVAERAVALAREVGDVHTELRATVSIGTVHFKAGRSVGVSILEDAHQRAVDSGCDDEAARALANLGTVASDLGNFALAGPTLDRAVTFTVARDLHGYTRHMLGHRARVRLETGDWPGARRDAEAALTGPDQPGGALVAALAVRGLIRIRRGEDGGRRDLVLAAEQGYPTGETQFTAPAAIALAEMYWLAGQPDRAAAEAKRALEVVDTSNYAWFGGTLAVWLWRCGHLDRAPDFADRPSRLLIEGNWRAAAAEWEARHCPYARAEALAAGDAAAVAEAVRIFDGFGAVVPARRLRTMLRERGDTVPRGPRPATAADPSGLTARQAEVLGLLVEGLTNAEIAARLTVSTKTVDHHVSAVLAKMGARTRNQAVALYLGKSSSGRQGPT